MIEFAVANNTYTGLSPWTAPNASSYKDLVLNENYAGRRLRLAAGQTWFRVLPKLRNSSKEWMLGIHAINYPGGRHVHPKTLVPGAKSVFDHAYQWFKTHRPNDLYSKSNKDGYKLLADPLSLCWVLVEENGEMVAKLILASAYDGSRGGTPGLGHQIWQISTDKDEDGNLIANLAHPEEGVQLGIDKIQPKGSRYPSYQIRVGRMPAPIKNYLDKMTPMEVAALRPLEEVIQLPDQDAEWAILAKIISQETVDEIRNTLV